MPTYSIQAAIVAGCLLISPVASAQTLALAAPPVARASNAAIAEQFVALAYGPDLSSGLPARDALARFSGDMRIYVSGSDLDRRAVESAMAATSHLTGVPMQLVTDGQPNVFVAVSDNPSASFRTTLRELLLAALNREQTDADEFISGVVDVQPCWILPVWTDQTRVLIKAAVIGVNGKTPRATIDRCILRKLAGALGLLGGDDTLPRSVFNLGAPVTRLSFEDQLMIRMAYTTSLPAGLDINHARAEAELTLQRLRPR